MDLYRMTVNRYKAFGLEKKDYNISNKIHLMDIFGVDIVRICQDDFMTIVWLCMFYSTYETKQNIEHQIKELEVIEVEKETIILRI